MHQSSFFSNDFLTFYRDLAANNDRDWFHANRKRYEQNVKKPFERFVSTLIQEMRKTDPAIDLEPKDAIFRINRDVRFSKDKSPYKLRSSAIISRGGKKDHVSPGLYVEAGPEHLAVYGGIYMPEREQLAAIRDHIIRNPERFERLLGEKAFRTTFGTLHGDRNKILPKEMRSAAEAQPLLYNKAFYFYAHLPAETVLEPDVITRVMACHAAGADMAEFLFEPLKPR